ncbi:hypothetical protein WJX79_009288 [Trebouxia sp. C0005]
MQRSSVLLQLIALCCTACLCANARTLAAAPAPSTEASCTLTTELETGPYYLDDILFRSNISEGQNGIPLLLKIQIVDTDCEPVVDAFVDIWQCNSTGFYSGFTLSGEDGSSGGASAFSPTGAPTNAPAGQAAPAYMEGASPEGSPDGSAMGQNMTGSSVGQNMTGSSAGGSSGGGGSPDDTTTVAAGVSAAAAAAGQQSATTDDYMWLRGVQQTDEDGMVEFETIVPGWYSGRTAHIHVKVHVPYNTSIVDEMSEFDDSHVAHTAQFFFDPTLYDQVAATYPYTLDLTTRTTNAEDHVYSADTSAVLDITLDGSSLSEGLTATMKSVIDPSSTPAAGV